MTYIKFLSADQGKLLFTLSNKQEVLSNDVNEIANIILKYAKKDFFLSSTMEFAREEGFKRNDSAMALYKKAEKLAWRM